MHVDSVSDTKAILEQLRQSRLAVAVGNDASPSASVAMLNFLTARGSSSARRGSRTSIPRA